jgi:hypothetical protein
LVESDADLASLLASGERATFHGPPASAISTLQTAIGIAERDDRQAEMVAARWLLGVAQSASGHYGQSLIMLMPLLEAGEGAEDDEHAPARRLFASLSAATAASVHRGLGRHEAARVLDGRGLDLAGAAAEATFDCELGLVSDAVGLGELEVARAGLTRVDLVIEGRGGDWWRQRVRLGWARAEVALLAEEPSEAVVAASTSVKGAEAARAPRHVAKGLLFQGVAELQAGSADALTTLRRAATLADGLSAAPLTWQIRALVGAMLGGEETEEGARSLSAARSAVLTIASDLPPPLRGDWLARPNVSALLEG